MKNVAMGKMCLALQSKVIVLSLILFRLLNEMTVN